MAALLITLGVIAGRSTAPGVRSPSITSQARHVMKQGRPADHRPQRTRMGAVAAATRFLDALRWTVLVDRPRRTAVIGRFAAPGASLRLGKVVSRGVVDLRSAVAAPPVVARSAFLGYRVARFTPRRTTVSVWGMALFGSAVYEPVSQWATSTFELVWQNGAWKVAAMRSRPGPSPRWSLTELARELGTFDEYRHVP